MVEYVKLKSCVRRTYAGACPTDVNIWEVLQLDHLLFKGIYDVVGLFAMHRWLLFVLLLNFKRSIGIIQVSWFEV